MMMLTEHTAAMMEVENGTDPRTTSSAARAISNRVIGQVPARIAEPRPHLARGRGVQRGVRAQCRGRADLDANSRRKPGRLDARSASGSRSSPREAGATPPRVERTYARMRESYDRICDG